jgi:hypothetical protein
VVIPHASAEWTGLVVATSVSKSTACSDFKPSFIRAIFASGYRSSTYLLFLPIQLDQIVDRDATSLSYAGVTIGRGQGLDLLETRGWADRASGVIEA